MSGKEFASEENFGSSLLLVLLAMVFVLTFTTLGCWSRNASGRPARKALAARSAAWNVLGSCALVLFVVVAWTMVTIVGVGLIGRTRSGNAFNPHKILQVPSSCSQAEIRKAYRELSKVLHPDVRGTGDEAQFILLSTAYRALIKSPAKENYRLFGHPDGSDALGADRPEALGRFYNWVTQSVQSFGQWLRTKFGRT
ncbi:dnaJ protein ERDJ2-like [Drosophila pseudoobscura]|uniref:DnaJ protein ERDJ2-like n=1 Tax=Drosophila pseudoobscura pseudoobscura TaxID=46245 RepID=A0A6I8V089_DROPS|nr:dnaJ protein ERDJ2 [Drosophila pseudoobscura]